MRLHFGFIMIAWLYLALVSLYALNTPHWQVPDEPAHYNYIRTIAENAALPVLQIGDYNQAYLDEIKKRKFPADLSIDSIRYESHQPPSYYLLAAPFYKLGEASPTDVRLLGLRLYSALLGVVLLAIVYRIASLLFPADRMLPLLTIVLVAFVPQHLAMEGSVNNDALAEVVLGGVVLGLLTMLDSDRWTADAGKKYWLTVGFLIGLGFLTKTTTYISVGLVALTLFLLWRKSQLTRQQLSFMVPSLFIALLLGSIWFARDALTYGPTDWLGLQRHNIVVAGQPLTLELYPNYFVAATDYFPTMFRSFWGLFGWMGVVLDARIYNALFYFTLFASLGFMIYRLRTKLTIQLSNQLLLLLAWFSLMLIGTVAYSLEFYQAQGRYLFPALGAIAIFLALGLREWLRIIGRFGARVGIQQPVTEWTLFGVLLIAFVVLDLVCLRFLIPELTSR